MLKKSDKIQIKIEKIVNGGEGLGYYDGFAVFVPMSVPGDVVKVEIISLKKTYGRGLIVEIIEPSLDRIEDIKKLSFEDFGGCSFGMIKYDAQLKYKKLILEDVIKKIGKLEKFHIREVIGAEFPYNYRNKIIEPFSEVEGKIITGFYKRKSHHVFEVDENILNSKLGNKVIFELKKVLNRGKLSVYNEKKHNGILRHIMIRTNSKNEVMLILIVNDSKVKKVYNDILFELKNKIKEIKSVYLSFNTKKTNVALGEKNKLLFGSKTLKESINGIEFNISPTSFFQINLEQTKKLYNSAISVTKNLKEKIVVDAYSGTGTIAMILSKNAKKVYAIEIVEAATKDGIKTATENGINNITFINGKVEEKLIEIIENGEKIDTIFFDPPRKGIDEKSLIKIGETGVKEIIYISCNPSTFARDTEILIKFGYKIDEIQPVDMFPNTEHIEVIGRFYK